MAAFKSQPRRRRFMNKPYRINRQPWAPWFIVAVRARNQRQGRQSGSARHRLTPQRQRHGGNQDPPRRYKRYPTQPHQHRAGVMRASGEHSQGTLEIRSLALMPVTLTAPSTGPCREMLLHGGIGIWLAAKRLHQGHFARSAGSAADRFSLNRDGPLGAPSVLLGCWTAVMGLMQSAKLNGHDPYAYLKDVLARLPTHKNSQVEELLPHRWTPLPT